MGIRKGYWGAETEVSPTQWRVEIALLQERLLQQKRLISLQRRQLNAATKKNSGTTAAEEKLKQSERLRKIARQLDIVGKKTGAMALELERLRKEKKTEDSLGGFSELEGGTV